MLTSTDKIEVDGTEYSINDEFRDQAIQLADSLSLDEVEAARLLVRGQIRSQELDRPPISCAIIDFHEYRTFLVDALRLALKLSFDADLQDEDRDEIRRRVAHVVEDSSSRKTQRSSFAQRCLATLSQIEQWLNKLAEQAQKYAAVGQVSSPDHDEVMGIQQHNLTQQHESIGTILAYLVKLNYTSLEDLRSLLAQMRQVDKWNSIAIHYVPSMISFFSQYGSANGAASHSDARSIHRTLLESRDSNPWPLRNLQAAATTWWLAEYNSWYFDMPSDHVAIEDEDAETEERIRSEALSQALQHGAFQCTLSICSQIRSSDWYDPARIELIRSLLNDAPVLPFEPATISPYFREIVMEHFEMFTYAFIAHMPDALRKFKIEEEDQRRRLLSGFPTNGPGEVGENERHLERFFVIMSYAFEGRPDAASEFWVDTDSNLYGFLQWFSRRTSTPVVGAFCEMLRAVSEGQDCAVSAHQFLIDGASGTSGRIRRSATISWAQILDELEFYASKVRESPSTNLATSYNGKPKAVDIDEPETPAMLECYLRLVAHLCDQSEEVKSWILSHTSNKIIDTMFLLSHNTVPSRIRACAYSCLRAFLNPEVPEITNIIWNALDQWVSSGFSSGGNIPRPTRVANISTWAEEVTFEAISNNFTEMNSFVMLLTSLISASDAVSELHDTLPFPEQLGSSYRMPGIEPYIDLVLGKIFANKLPNLDVLQSRILGTSVFNFIQTCLSTFNENLIILAHRTGMALDDAINASSLLSYVRSHPFSRVIEWMFNERVIAALFPLAHQDISEIVSAQEDSPLVLSLLGTIQAINLVMDLQSTYLDIVRPLIKTQSHSHRQPVSNPALASFEDAVSNHLRVIADLAYYSGSGRQQLALDSMDLLKKFATSRKLNAPQSAKVGSRVMSNRLIGVLQGNNDVEAIAKSMSQSLSWDDRELDFGPSAPGYRSKYAILDFLEQTLSANPSQPNLAHALLGFMCNSFTVSVEPSSVFANHAALFHTVLALCVEYPDWIVDRMAYFTLDLRCKAASIINSLWTSPLTSGLVLAELKELAVLRALWSRTGLVDAETPWESGPARSSLFFYEGGSTTFELYVKERGYLFALAAAEFRLASGEATSLWKSQLLSTVFGTSIIEGVEQPNAMIFDMLDFLELETANGPSQPETPLLEGTNLSSFIDSEDEKPDCFNVKLLSLLLALKVRQMKKNGGLPDQAAEDRATTENFQTLACFEGLNNYGTLEEERLRALSSWSDLVVVLVRNCSTESSDRAAMALQALQTISPRLEYYATLNKIETQIFASLVQTLLNELEVKSTVLQAGRAGEIASDKLYQLFKISLRAIGNPDTSTHLHESFYSICYRYLTSIAETSSGPAARRQLSTQTIKAAGDTLIDTVCEDAYGAAGTCSIAALLLLDALARLAVEDNSQYMLDSLARSNFVSVIVETIADMPGELNRAAPSGNLPPFLFPIPPSLPSHPPPKPTLTP